MSTKHIHRLLGILLAPCLVMAGQDPEENRPSEHYCPITLQVMKDPIVADDGQSYERKALEQYLNTVILTDDTAKCLKSSDNEGAVYKDTPHGKKDEHHNNQKISPLTRAPISGKFVPNMALKKMIEDWQPGASRAPCVLDQRSPAEMVKRVQAEFAKNQALLTPAQTAKGKEIVAFLGNTGAGKSTLINLLAGKELKVSEDGEDFVLVDPDDTSAMIIGTGGNSETLYPKAVDVGNLRFFDLPGFNDTDGSERNLINAAFIRKILLEAASVRLVFVVGQDQFTADRSNSVRQMFQAILQLFVLAHETDQIINNGVFVATKTSCADTVDIIQFLLKKTDSKDKEVLNHQLQAWYGAKKFYRIYHPDKDQEGEKNKCVQSALLQAIQNIPAAKVQGINISALYPPETQSALEKMFYKVLQDFFEGGLKNVPDSVSAYDKAIASYSEADFWQNLENTYREQDKAMALLKEFSAQPYAKALINLQKNQEKQRQTHVDTLNKGRQARIADVQQRTKVKTNAVILSIPQASNDLITFDFGYHKDFYEQVCGTGISDLATDPEEQEVVRRTYADVMGSHSHQQFMRWLEKFGGISGMTNRYDHMRQRMDVVENQLVLAPGMMKQMDAVELKLLTKQENAQRKSQDQLENEARQRMVGGYVEIHRSIQKQIANIPAVARGYADVYWRFLNGRLIYTHPQTGAKIEWRFCDLANPLSGEFVLPAQCDEDTKKYVSINTGFRTKKGGNKSEVWIMPRFWLAAHIDGMAKHYKPILDKWNKEIPVGILWTYGEWEANDGDCGYDVTETFGQISNNGNLYEKAKKSPRTHNPHPPTAEHTLSCFVFNLN